MMDSQSDGWRVYLLGASRIYETLHCPETAAGSAPIGHNENYENRSPIKQFLVSLLAYLDVAGTCSTGRETLISGDFWETHGGGWEYNLGLPSISRSSLDMNGTLSHIRQSWSRLMSILVDISAFAERKANGMSKSIQQNVFRGLGLRFSRIEAAVQRVLVLADKFCTGVAQLGMPWALFIAGTEIVSEARRDSVREKFIDMRRFGMKVNTPIHIN
jgi:hypothetical protein